MRPQNGSNCRKVFLVPIEIFQRKRPSIEGEFARAAMNHDMDRIQVLAAKQGARDLLRSGSFTLEQHRLHAGPQSGDEHRNVGNCGIYEDDFPACGPNFRVKSGVRKE
jgi:hypothetical protein